MAVDAINEGERWLYCKAPDPPLEVTVNRVVSQSGNAKVRVQFEEGAQAGEIVWVARRTLKAPWAKRGEYLASERQWAAIRSAGQQASRTAQEAAGMVIDLVVGSEVAWLKAWGILGVRDFDSLAALTPTITVTVGAACIEESGVRYFAWPTALEVAKALTRLRPAPILDYVDAEQPVWVEDNRETGGEPRRATAMIAACDLMRSWCGDENVSKWHEVEHIRRDNARLYELLQKALDVMEGQADSYYTYRAKRIRGEAGRTFGPKPDWVKRL